MENENVGEYSKKKHLDEMDSDRPLKKAKYLWQVKGKYHLKDNNTISDNTNEDVSTSSVQCNNDNIDSVPITNNNMSQARNKNICSDRSCIEALIASSDKIMDFSEPESPPKNIDKSISDEIPITLVKPPKNEDYYLRKWQARQIAKGFVDNTINRVLESWMVAAPFDATDFVENCDHGGKVEDEGILMAIQSHGLQSGNRNDLILQGGSNSFVPKPSGTKSVSGCTCSRTRAEVQKPPLFHHSDDDFNMNYYENLCVLKDTQPLRSSYTSRGERNLEGRVELLSTLDNQEPDHNSLCMNDTDFLDAAVAVAIQKKGLTSLNYVDCG